MANLLPQQVYVSATGSPLVGGTLTAYIPTTTTLKPIYRDSTGTTQMTNPTSGGDVFNQYGSVTTGIFGSGLYDLLIKDASGNTVNYYHNVGNAADNITNSSGGSASATALSPNNNRVINTNFRLGPNGQLVYTSQSLASGGVPAANWYVLTQTGAITASINTTSSILNTPTSLTINQSNGAAQGFGILQVIPSEATYAMRGQLIQASMDFYSSIGYTAYMAILAVTTANDAPTINVVGSWTNPTYTAGNFFTSAASPISPVASVNLTVNTSTTLATSGTVPQTATNLMLFVYFPGGTVASGTLVDFSKAALYESPTALSIRPVHNSVEFAANNSAQNIDYKTASSSASLNFLNLNSTYVAYDIILSNVLPANSGDSLWLRISEDNSTFLSTAIYWYAYSKLTSANGTGSGTVTTAVGGAQGQLVIEDTIGSSSGRGISGTIRIYNPSATSKCKFTWLTSKETDAGVTTSAWGGGDINFVGAILGMQFLCSTGNIASGTIEIKGVPA